MKLLLTTFFSLFTFYFLFPQSEFASPLDIPLLLSGNFGELRPNHFHAGVDFKTQGKEGLNIYTIKEGYVSRIKVGAYGYGKALYVTHPNGYTSVYAHLQKFSPVIEAYVKKHQYAKKTFEIEIYPKANELLLKKGEILGLGGNTGSSAGPHLHFEIRDSSAKAVNPLLFGYEIKDDIAPELHQLVVYVLGNESHINQSQLPQRIYLTKQANGAYQSDKIYASGTIGLGIESIDKQNDTYHKNGVYKVSLLMNGKMQFQYVFNSLNFNEARYINTFMDYATYTEKKTRVQLLYKTKGNRISTIYTTNVNDGKLEIQEGMSYMITILIEDIKGNTTRINVPIEGKKQEIKEPRPIVDGTLLIANREQNYVFEGGSVYFQKIPSMKIF